MKRHLLLFTLLFAAVSVSAQDCSELFFSSYVEGSNNNKAIEIYNPTSEAVSLNDYSIARYNNGATAVEDQTTVNIGQLAGGNSVMVDPYSTFVIVLDKRDKEAMCLDFPIWYGNMLIDTLRDSLDVPILDDEGEVIFTNQFEEVPECNGGGFYPIHGEEYDYNEKYDLAGKANIFGSPVYNENKTIYWNGNDAIALIKGVSANADYSNIVDVVGVIGEDPAITYPSAGAWIDTLGYAVTKDRTLIRRRAIKTGQVKAAGLGDAWDVNTDPYQWVSLPRNTFDVLGSHECECDPNFLGNNSILSNLVEVNVFPNPASQSFINIQADMNFESVELYSISGELVAQRKVMGRLNNYQMALDNIAPGLYILKLDMGTEGMITRKLSIQ